MDRLFELLGCVVVLFAVSVQCDLPGIPQFSSPSRVYLGNNRGYRDVLIAIGERVPEDANLIDKIKSVFTDFSSFLYQATNIYSNNGVFFEEIRILVPESWSNNDSYEVPSWETFALSDIRIDEPDDGPNRNQPSTNKPTQCGAPGMYIHLTPEYITDDIKASIYGDRNRTLTHEWSHFRWGVFDEYPLEGGLHFYAASNGNYEATRCVSGITGVMRTADGQPCVTDSSGRPDDKCRFFDDRVQSESYEASLMYKQFLPAMKTFCDDATRTGGIPSRTHNLEAPNEQNNLCASRSVWEVLREHSDFPQGTTQNAPNNPMPQINIVPSFRVVKRRFQALPTVVVLDRSGSMGGNGRLHTLRQASFNLISRVLEDTQLFGIVNFNSRSHIVRYATTPVGTNRTAAIDALPKEASGGTHIGTAVLNGVRALQNTSNDDVSGSQIILLTDGEENASSRTKLEELTIDELRGVIVHTIAISTDAKRNLEEIANRTKGRTFFQRDNSAALFNIFSRLAIQDSSQIVEILSETFDFTNGTITRSFDVGQFSTGRMTILVAFPELETTDVISVEVIKPNGAVIDAATQQPDSYQFVEDFDLYQIDTQAELGEWQIRVTMGTKSMNQTGTMHVETKRSALNEALPIEADAQWALQDMQPNQIQTLFVTVNQGYTPVAGAKVVVEISLPDNTIAKLPVWDDGKGSDIRAKDGIYSAFFTQFKGSGRYSMQVSVMGKGGVTKLMKGSRVGQGPAAVDPRKGTAESPEGVDTGAFERIIDGESFRCTDDEKCRGDKDFYAPYRIADLRGYIITENKTAILTFTAPGDDLFHGTAAYYEIHLSKNLTLLMTDLSNATKLQYLPEELRTNETEPPYVISGNLTNPQPARSTEVFEIQLPLKAGNFSYIFSVVAVDDEGLRSQPSNFASVSAKEFIKVELHPPETNLPVILGSSLSFLFLLLLLLLLLTLLLFRKRRQKKVHDNSETGHSMVDEIILGQLTEGNFVQGNISDELGNRLHAKHNPPVPQIRGQAIISSSDQSRYVYRDPETDKFSKAYEFVGGKSHTGNETETEFSKAYEFVGGKSHTGNKTETAYNFVGPTSQGSDNVRYPLIQVGSKRDDLKTANKIYSDPSQGSDNPGFEYNEHQQGDGRYLSALAPPPTGPPPRPIKQSPQHNGLAVGHRQVDHHPIKGDVTPIKKPPLPPKIPTRNDDHSDSDNSDKFDYEPVSDQNSNSQLTMNMLRPEKGARPMIPPKHAVIPQTTGMPIVKQYDDSDDSDDDDTMYDKPPIDIITSTIGGGKPVPSPRSIDENDRPYDDPPPSNNQLGHDGADSDSDSNDYEPVEDPNAVLGLSSS